MVIVQLMTQRYPGYMTKKAFDESSSGGIKCFFIIDLYAGTTAYPASKSIMYK
jgi:hypothetical protein